MTTATKTFNFIKSMLAIAKNRYLSLNIKKLLFNIITTALLGIIIRYIIFYCTNIDPLFIIDSAGKIKMESVAFYTSISTIRVLLNALNDIHIKPNTVLMSNGYFIGGKDLLNPSPPGPVQNNNPPAQAGPSSQPATGQNNNPPAQAGPSSQPVTGQNANSSIQPAAVPNNGSMVAGGAYTQQVDQLLLNPDGVTDQPYARGLASLLDPDIHNHHHLQMPSNIGGKDREYLRMMVRRYHGDNYNSNRHYPNTKKIRAFLRNQN